MENHPIPQDVTGFKFKLIGSVTVKQFLYLLGFGILATVAFVLHINFFLRIPLILFFASIGVALAFIPIEGRPMDIMILNFAKTIPSENRYIWRKRGANIASFEVFRITVQKTKTPVQQLSAPADDRADKRAILLSRLRNSQFRPDEGEIKFFNNIKSFFDEEPGDRTHPAEPKNEGIPTPVPISVKNLDTDDIFVKPQVQQIDIKDLQKELADAKQEQAKQPTSSELSEKIVKLEAELAQSLSEKDELARKVVDYETSSARAEEKVVTPRTEQAPQEAQNVKFVSPSASLRAGFPTLPDIPNIVLGIVRDPRGKTLPNILVEVVDKDNVPVRAFKTNALGQFASATPLANGTYKVYFEDPQKQHTFELIEISLNGSIFDPIEITSVDSREKLRRELFGGNAGAQAS